MNLDTVKCPVRQSPIQRTVRNCSSKCAHDCAQLQYTIQHRTVLIISPHRPTQSSTHMITDMLLLALTAETCSSLAGHRVGKDISPHRALTIATRQNRVAIVDARCDKEDHGQVAACSKCCGTSGHRDPEI